MASWSQKRRALYIIAVLAVLFLVAVLVFFQVFYKAPTCLDGEQNGDEEGVDCGGSCEKVCSFEAAPPQVLWSRFFEVAPRVYSVVALVENPNVGAEAHDVPYIFKLRDTDGILVYERKGTLYIPPDERTIPVFESNIVSGERDIRRVFFEFLAEPKWQRAEGPQLKVKAEGAQLSGADTAPRLDARIKNNNVENVSNIEVVAILTGINGNAVAASRTVVDFIEGGSSRPIVFTWSRAFDVDIATIDIVPIVTPRQ